MKVHTGTREKNCICNYCQKSFADNWKLKRHMRVHNLCISIDI